MERRTPLHVHQFLRWFNDVDHDEAVHTLTPCFGREGYGLRFDPSLASRIVCGVLYRQLRPDSSWTCDIDGSAYYLDTTYISANREIVGCLQERIGADEAAYALCLLDLAETELIDIRYHVGDYGIKTRALYVGLDALGEVWREATPPGRDVFDRDGYVYILGAPDFYKIGRAKKVDGRVKQLEIQLPWQVEIVHVIACEDYIAAEQRLHKKFADRRANGEWFMLTPDDVDWLKGVSRIPANGALASETV